MGYNAAMLYEALITCPTCGHSKEVHMPVHGFETEYCCDGCGLMLRPRAGDDCVFCSYSNTICPPNQEKRSCCSDG